MENQDVQDCIEWTTYWKFIYDSKGTSKGNHITTSKNRMF